MRPIESAEQQRWVGNQVTPFVVGAALGGLACSLNARRTERLKQHSSDSLLPYADDVREVLGTHNYNYAVVGGLPIDAFNQSESTIDTANRAIIVPCSFDTPLLRSNLTPRDYDIFLLGDAATQNFSMASPETLKSIKHSLEQSAGKRAQSNRQPQPVMSVFTFDGHNSLFHTATKLQPDGSVTLSQGFVDQTLPDNALETWDLVLPHGTVVKILSPWEQYWRSMTRFPSGIKPKDTPKLNQMLHKLRSTPGLSAEECAPLAQAYSSYYTAMLEGNSIAALRQEWHTHPRNSARIAALAKLSTARTVLDYGGRVPALQVLVQSAPVVFDYFSGGS
jgi:hypothetical protein